VDGQGQNESEKRKIPRFPAAAVLVAAVVLGWWLWPTGDFNPALGPINNVFGDKTMVMVSRVVVLVGGLTLAVWAILSVITQVRNGNWLQNFGPLKPKPEEQLADQAAKELKAAPPEGKDVSALKDRLATTEEVLRRTVDERDEALARADSLSPRQEEARHERGNGGTPGEATGG